MCSFIHLQQKAVFAVIHVHQMDTHTGIHLLPPYGLWFSLSFWRSHTWARADPMQRDLNLLFFLLTLLLDSALWVGNRRVSMNMTPRGGKHLGDGNAGTFLIQSVQREKAYSRPELVKSLSQWWTCHRREEGDWSGIVSRQGHCESRVMSWSDMAICWVSLMEIWKRCKEGI